MYLRTTEENWNGTDHMARALLDKIIQPDIDFERVHGRSNSLYIPNGTFSTRELLGADDWTMKHIAMTKELCMVILTFPYTNAKG